VNSNFLQGTVALTTSVALVAFFAFSALEPATLSAQSTTDSDNVQVSLNVQENITITDAPNTSMDQMGASDDYATASSTWTVTTNASAGYKLSVKSNTAPALQGDSNGESFEDYTESPSDDPEPFSLDSNSYQFGFSAYGNDVSTSEYGDDTNCGSGDPTSNSLEYEGFTTSSQTIAQRSSVTPTSGTDTSVCYGAGQNGVFAPSGGYTATIVATANTQ